MLFRLVESIDPIGPEESGCSDDRGEYVEPTAFADTDGTGPSHESGYDEAEVETSETAQVEAVEETQVDATPVVEKKPIPLGPISTDDAPGDEDSGPIAE